MQKWMPPFRVNDLDVYLLKVTNKILIDLVFALPDERTLLVLIGGEQRRHHRLVMYVLSVTK